MALSHFLRQSHFAVITYNCLTYSEKLPEKTANKRCFICETNPFFRCERTGLRGKHGEEFRRIMFL